MSQKSKIKSRQVTYKLKHPFEWGSETISEIVLNRPKGKHLKKFGQDIKVGEIIGIASSVSGQAPPVFDEMDAEDYLAVVGIVGDFLGSGQGIGANS